MTKTKPERVDFLDTARGLAILVVFLFHALGGAYKANYFPWDDLFPDFSRPPKDDWTYFLFLPFSFGAVGVAVFFVISGFCIHWSNATRPQSIAEFYFRRLARIYPPYLFALLLFAFVWPTSRLDLSLLFSWRQILTHLLLIHNFALGTFFGINGAFWSIAVEAQLYLLYPLVFILSRRFSWKVVLLGSAACELSLRLVNGIWPAVTESMPPHILLASPFAFWFSWSLGAYLAHRYLAQEKIGFARKWILLLVATCIASYLFLPLQSFTFPIASLATFGIFANLLFNRPAEQKAPGFLSRHLAQAGTVSYSLYLFHIPFTKGWLNCWRALGVDAPWLLLLIAIPLWFPLLWFSRLTYRYIELPSASLGKLWPVMKEWFDRRRNAAPPVALAPFRDPLQGG